MITLVLLTFVDLFVFVFNMLLIVRIIMSYFAGPSSRVYANVVSLTEPLLGPVRQVLPQVMPGLDLAPLATFLLLQGVQWLLHVLLRA